MRVFSRFAGFVLGTVFYALLDLIDGKVPNYALAAIVGLAISWIVDAQYERGE